MTRLLLLAAVTGAAVGCTSINAVGPLAKHAGSADKKDAPPAEAKAEPAPVVPTATGGRPVPPAILITPGEVAPDNPAAAATKLGNEIEYDLKNTPPAPNTPIISRYKNGEKVQ
jgi:hypothetical protein